MKATKQEVKKYKKLLWLFNLLKKIQLDKEKTRFSGTLWQEGTNQMITVVIHEETRTGFIFRPHFAQSTIPDDIADRLLKIVEEQDAK